MSSRIPQGCLFVLHLLSPQLREVLNDLRHFDSNLLPLSIFALLYTLLHSRSSLRPFRYCHSHLVQTSTLTKRGHQHLANKASLSCDPPHSPPPAPQPTLSIILKSLNPQTYQTSQTPSNTGTQISNHGAPPRLVYPNPPQTPHSIPSPSSPIIIYRQILTSNNTQNLSKQSSQTQQQPTSAQQPTPT